MTFQKRTTVLIIVLLFTLLLTNCSSVQDIINYSTPSAAHETPYDVLPSSTPSLDSEISGLLANYGWTIDQQISTQSVQLPQSFQHYPGDFPYAIYWAYNNEFNNQIGLDLVPFLDQRVRATIYLLNERLPEEFLPHKDARAIVITSGDTIIGAWIEKVAGFACSLDRTLFDEIVGQDWDQWLLSSGVVDVSNELDISLSIMEPEEIIETYYTALNEHNYQILNAVQSRRNISFDLYVNKDELALFNQQDDSSMTRWVENIESSQLMSIRLLGNPRHCLPVYEARVDFLFFDPRIPTIREGENLRFVVLKEEIKGLGWRIEEINTAPGVSQRLCAP